MHNHFKSFNLFSLFIAAILVFFISCAQNLPEPVLTDYSVIFEYGDEESSPAARLSIFASSNSYVRRYQKIKITSVETGYCWDTEVLSMLQADDAQWVGCSNLVAPAEEQIPVGRYEVTYINADEKEVTLNVDVQYDTNFYDILLPALPAFMSKKRGIEKIAIYDKSHVLIYFGDRTSELITTRDIWNRYREASTYQVIWYTRNGSVICITPEKLVVPEVEKTDEENTLEEKDN